MWKLRALLYIYMHVYKDSLQLLTWPMACVYETLIISLTARSSWWQEGANLFDIPAEPCFSVLFNEWGTVHKPLCSGWWGNQMISSQLCCVVKQSWFNALLYWFGPPVICATSACWIWMSREQETVPLYLFSPPVLLLHPFPHLSLARSLSPFKSHPTNAQNSHSICLRRFYFLCVFCQLFKCLKDWRHIFKCTWVLLAFILPFTLLSCFLFVILCFISSLNKISCCCKQIQIRYSDIRQITL